MSGIDDLVSTEWLAARLNAPDIRIVDASWYLPVMKRDAKSEYAERHIPGAVYFDIDEISDSSSGLPHMLPPPEKFASRMRKMGLGDGSRIVVYDASGGNMSAPRAWWMFRAFGHQDVAILDGGLKKWQAEGRPVEDMPPAPRDRHFTARSNGALVRDLEQMRAIVTKGSPQVVDARSAGRFTGKDPEPRAGLRGGHMPGAKNLPFNLLTDPATGQFWPKDRLRQVLTEAGLDLNAPTVTTCGSGVSACVIAFALHLLGNRQVAVYDGSWTEWGGLPDTPVVTG